MSNSNGGLSPLLKAKTVYELKTFCKNQKIGGYADLNEDRLIAFIIEKIPEEEIKKFVYPKEDSTKEKEPEDGVQEKDEQKQDTKKEVLDFVIPFPHKFVIYTGRDKEGIAPGINRFKYPKGKKVLVTKEDGDKILSRFRDQYKEA